MKKIKGNWKFAFSLQATESQIQLTNQSVEQNGVTVNIEKVAFTPMSFIVHYNQQATEQVQDKWGVMRHTLDYVSLRGLREIYPRLPWEGNAGLAKVSPHTISWSALHLVSCFICGI